MATAPHVAPRTVRKLAAAAVVAAALGLLAAVLVLVATGAGSAASAFGGAPAARDLRGSVGGGGRGSSGGGKGSSGGSGASSGSGRSTGFRSTSTVYTTRYHSWLPWIIAYEVAFAPHRYTHSKNLTRTYAGDTPPCSDAERTDAELCVRMGQANFTEEAVRYPVVNGSQPDANATSFWCDQAPAQLVEIVDYCFPTCNTTALDADFGYWGRTLTDEPIATACSVNGFDAVLASVATGAASPGRGGASTSAWLGVVGGAALFLAGGGGRLC